MIIKIIKWFNNDNNNYNNDNNNSNDNDDMYLGCDKQLAAHFRLLCVY